MGAKTFVNNTKQNLIVTLLIREGDSVQGPEKTQKFPLSAGETKNVSYPETFLNGLSFNWNDPVGQAENALTKKVSNRGAAPTFDALLNTNSVIIINSVTGMDVTGRN